MVGAFFGPLPPVIHRGQASQFDAGVMEDVIATRQAGRTAKTLPDPIPSYVEGFAAGRDCADVGQVVIMRRPGYPWRVMMIADCPAAGDGTLAWMIAGDIYFEIDYQTRMAWEVPYKRACSIEWGAFIPEGIE